ncbi:IclR family transcriptional regulator [Alcaligenaceae bacterium]|nr:IclR family transcriptional regulator [Alcaligenaceae bacterium]
MDSTSIKALRVIEALAASDEPRGVAELGRSLGLTKSNTFRILSTLSGLGYAKSHGESGRYSLTLNIWEQGMKVIDRHPVRRVALPNMRMLHANVTETILLTTLESSDVLYIGKVESENPIRASAREGQRAPAWRTASGRSMLAFHPKEDIEQVLSAANFDDAERAEFLEMLQRVRERGFATSVNGTRVGVNSVAAPLWSGEDAPWTSVSISGPAERFTAERMDELGIMVLNCATRISESLGV